MKIEAKIFEILPCMRDLDGGPNERATPLLTEQLCAERDRIDRQIVEMQRSREVLDGVIANATGEQLKRSGTKAS